MVEKIADEDMPLWLNPEGDNHHSDSFQTLNDGKMCHILLEAYNFLD